MHSPNSSTMLLQELVSPEATFDPESGLAFLEDEAVGTVVLHAHPKTGIITFLGEIGSFPEEKLKSLQRPLLEACWNWNATAGSAIGVEDQRILLTNQLSSLQLQSQPFREQLEQFLVTLEHWRRLVELDPDEWCAPTQLANFAKAEAFPAEKLHQLLSQTAKGLHLDPWEPISQDPVLYQLNFSDDFRLDIFANEQITICGDLGPLPVKQPEALHAKLLQANITLSESHGGVFAIEPVTGHAALCSKLPTTQETAEEFQVFLREMANLTLRWSCALVDRPVPEEDPLFLLTQVRI